MRHVATLALLFFALATTALAGDAVRCQTYEEPTLGRLQTLCSDGSRAISTWSPTLQQWTTTVTAPAGKTAPGGSTPRPASGRGAVADAQWRRPTHENL